MPYYTFDAELTAVISVEAASPEQAKAWLLEALTSAEANLGALPDGNPILAEISLDSADETKALFIREEMF